MRASLKLNNMIFHNCHFSKSNLFYFLQENWVRNVVGVMEIPFELSTQKTVLNIKIFYAAVKKKIINF